MAEQLPFKELVEGSSPSGLTFETVPKRSPKIQKKVGRTISGFWV